MTTTNNSTQKNWRKEEFAKFYENPTRESLRNLLVNNLGEFPYLDLKQELHSLPRVARDLLGLANLGEGCLVIGVAEREDKTLESIGLNKITDKKTIEDGIKKFLPNTLSLSEEIKILDLAYEASEYPALVGKKFQVILITGDPKHLPFVSMADGKDIRKNAIYVRRGTSTEEANYEELQGIINRRIETGYSSQSEIDLQTHIEELKTLYSYIKRGEVITTLMQENGKPKKSVESSLNSSYSSLERLLTQSEIDARNKRSYQPEWIANSQYPKEDFEEFIAKMIEKKKTRIKISLDVADL